jgi:hypothetical protein
VNTQTDEAHCGRCGHACDAPETCSDPSGPALGLDCYCPNVNDVACNGACVSLGTVQNCSACGDACTAPASACHASECACPTAGETACGDHCADLNVGEAATDPIEDCGACGVTCKAGATCAAGECSCPGDAATYKYCDEDSITGATDGAYACIPVTTTKSCGECGNACLDQSMCQATGSPTTAAGYECVCMGGDAGKAHCPGIGCRDLDTDTAHCGTCGHACAAGETCCNGVCADLDDSEAHCGACGDPCNSGETCCSGNCADLDNDDANCGICGRMCMGSCGFFNPCDCNSGICN